MSLTARWSHLAIWVTTLTITETAAAWTANVSGDVSLPFVQGDPVMSIGGAFNYPLTRVYALSVSQGIEKNFYVDSQAKEFELSDTALSFNIFPRSLVPKATFAVRLIATLPTSYSSQINEVYSKPEVRWTGSYPVIDNVSLAMNAFFRYTWSRYETTKPQDLSGGWPLPEFSYGLGHSGSWSFIPEWSASYALSYSEIRYHTVTYQGSGDPAINVQPDQAYSVSLSINWQITPADSVYAAYSYGGLLLQPGVDDYVLFDKEDSRFSFGYARSFP